MVGHNSQILEYFVDIVLYADCSCLKVGKYGLGNTNMIASVDLKVTNIYHFFNALFNYKQFVLEPINLRIMQSYTSSRQVSIPSQFSDLLICKIVASCRMAMFSLIFLICPAFTREPMVAPIEAKRV